MNGAVPLIAPEHDRPSIDEVENETMGGGPAVAEAPAKKAA